MFCPLLLDQKENGVKFLSNQRASQILNIYNQIAPSLRVTQFDSARDKYYNSVFHFCPVFGEYGVQNERQVFCACVFVERVSRREVER